MPGFCLLSATREQHSHQAREDGSFQFQRTVAMVGHLLGSPGDWVWRIEGFGLRIKRNTTVWYCYLLPRTKSCINSVCVFLTCILRNDNYFSLLIAAFQDCFNERQNVKKIKNTVGLKTKFKEVFYYNSLSAFDEKCLQFSSFEALQSHNGLKYFD